MKSLAASVSLWLYVGICGEAVAALAVLGAVAIFQ
jgi:hypothetical protein